MAIGNSPWPIGVTMVGIHARTGREKIFSRNIARILFIIIQDNYKILNSFKSGIYNYDFI